MAYENQSETASWHLAGYSSDSSLLSRDYGRHVQRIERPRLWPGLGSLCHTSTESLDTLCRQCRQHKSLPMMASTQGRRRQDRTERHDAGRGHPQLQRTIRFLWATKVISGTSFFAVTDDERAKVAELKALMAAQLGDTPTMAEHVVPRRIYALKVNDGWERVMARSQCTVSCCVLRTGEEEQAAAQKYWHVSLMEVGSKMCVASAQLALVTRTIVVEPRKARAYHLRRIRRKDNENSAQAKDHLKSQILTNQRLTAEVFYQPGKKSRTHVEVIMGETLLSDSVVEAGFAQYRRLSKQYQREKVSEAGDCYSSQELVSVSSRESLVPHRPAPPPPLPPPPPHSVKPDSVGSTMPELLELIDHLMKKRKESVYLMASGSALNLAIWAQERGRDREEQGPGRHQYSAITKYQILLRKLRNENPYTIHEIRDLKESHYEQLVDMFVKWKVSYKEAQKNSDVAIDVVANIFLNFTNKNFGLVKYKHKCEKLETSLKYEVLLQNEGEDLAQMIVPVVATKLMCSIEKLETSTSGFVHVIERPQTLHQFISSSKSITALTLEALAKDILKGLYHFHVRGIAYKHLHPENVLMVKGRAALRPIDDQQECKAARDWPFEGEEAGGGDLGKPADVYNFGLLVLWMACRGADNYVTATIEFYCNVALVKMIMAEDPSQRPLVESLVCTCSSIFCSNSQWRSMPLKNYLKEVFSDAPTAEAEQESHDQPSELETGESTCESESILQPPTEEDSESDTSDSEAPKAEASSHQASAEREGKET